MDQERSSRHLQSLKLKLCNNYFLQKAMSSAPGILAFGNTWACALSRPWPGQVEQYLCWSAGAGKPCYFVFQKAAILHQLAMLTEFPEKHFSGNLFYSVVFCFYVALLLLVFFPLYKKHFIHFIKEVLKAWQIVLVIIRENEKNHKILTTSDSS